jgi:predicted dehydrogenase
MFIFAFQVEAFGSSRISWIPGLCGIPVVFKNQTCRFLGYWELGEISILDFQMLKTAIIGITGYGTEHLRLLLHGYQKGLMQPCAAVVINPDECETSILKLQQLGCRIYDSVEAMWAEENGSIDLCMIPSPISTHYPFARMALEHGSHVLLEKPVCGTIHEAEELIQYAEKVGKEICIGFQDLYSPQIIELKRRLVAGDFGRITSLKGWGSWPRPGSYYKRNNWAGRLKNGVGWVLDSPVNNAMAHFLFLMLYWAGSELKSFAQPTSMLADLFRAQEIPSFDTASMRLATADGPEIFYAVSHSGERTVQPMLRVEGEKGWFEWTHCGHVRIYLPDADETWPCVDIVRIRNLMIEHVCEWVNRREGHVVLARDAVLHTRIVSALHEANPIVNFPKDRIRYKPVEGDKFIYVDGLVDLLETAFRKGQLLSELSPDLGNGVPEPFELADYHAFTGGLAAGKLPVG